MGGEFPHMCVLFRTQGGQRVYVGGASLIAKNKVLTVAHKFNVIQDVNNPVDFRDTVNQFSIRCGEYNVKKENEIQRTKENFIYQEHIGPTCLPRPNESFGIPRKSKDCWSSGWGADSYEATALYSDGLRKVKLPVVPRDECEERLASQPRFAGKGFRLHE